MERLLPFMFCEDVLCHISVMYEEFEVLIHYKTGVMKGGSEGGPKFKAVNFEVMFLL